MRFGPPGRPLLLCALWCATIAAQPQTYVSGLIQDPSGAAVPDALVSVVNEDTGFRYNTRSQSSGGYVVASLPPGFYKISVRKEGFRTLVRFGVKLDAGQPVQVDFKLPLGSVQEVLTVTGSAPLLNMEDASVGTLVGRERIERLPLNGRGLLGLLELAPATVVTPATRGEAGQFSSGGQRPNANYFTIDGVSANTGVSAGGTPAQTTGGALPGMTALGSLHGLIPLGALEEFRVQTSSATAEFGKLPGAQVILSSRSGSNDLHGSLSSYFRDGTLDASDWFANRFNTRLTGQRMLDFGASLGGPVRRDRAFFFLSYEGMRLREPFAWRASVPTLKARANAPEWAQPVLALFPLPNGAALGTNLAEWRGQIGRTPRFDVASLRLDQAVTSRITVFARGNAAASSNQYTGTQVNELDMRAASLTLGGSFRLSPAAVIEARMNRSWAGGESLWKTAGGVDPGCVAGQALRYFRGAAGPCDTLLRFSLAGVGQAVLGAEPDQRQDQWQVVPAAALMLGGHQLRVGLDHRRYAPRRRDHAGSLSIIAEDQEDLLSRPDMWVATGTRQQIDGELSELSLFAQDAWRVHPRLTATFGLRWDYPRAPELTQQTSGATPPPAYGLPDQTRIWEHSTTNLAPRAGLAYRLTGQGKTVLRAGWGLFYDSTLSIATDLVNGGPFTLSQFVSGRRVPFSTLLSFGFEPGLRLPAVHQWNATLEQGIGERDVISAGYVGSVGRRLLRRELGGFENSETLWLALATNHGRSDYHSFQMQYRRAMSRGFQALASYTWSHAIDNSSSDTLLHRVGQGLGPEQDRGSSDFDVRQAFSAAFTYESQRRSRPWRGWAVDGIVRARTGFPMTPLSSEYSMGMTFANAFRPDLVPGESVWVADRGAPGGRRLNRAAFQATDNRQGNLGRNALRGFGMYQADLALRREFPMGKAFLQVRAEAFNLMNHGNFADPTRFLSSPLFGESPSMLNLMLGTGSPGSGLTPLFQSGGARSIQVSARFRF